MLIRTAYEGKDLISQYSYQCRLRAIIDQYLDMFGDGMKNWGLLTEEVHIAKGKSGARSHY